MGRGKLIKTLQLKEKGIKAVKKKVLLNTSHALTRFPSFSIFASFLMKVLIMELIRPRSQSEASKTHFTV